MITFDVAIVGGGPAGLSAAVAAGRMNRGVIVFQAGVPRATHAPRYYNLLGFPEGISGEDLLARGKEQMARWGAVFRDAAVVEASETPDRGARRFRLTLADGAVASASAIVLATGVKDVQPTCGSLYEETGRGAHFCAICDGREVDGERTAVVGSTAHAVGMVEALRDFTDDLHLLLDGEEDALDADSLASLRRWKVEIVPGSLETAQFEDGEVRFRTSNGRVLRYAHVFLALGVMPRNRVAESLGCGLDEAGYVRVDEECATTVPFVFAAGDCTGGLKQVTQAMAEGERAAMSACAALREADGPARAGAGDRGGRP